MLTTMRNQGCDVACFCVLTSLFRSTCGGTLDAPTTSTKTLCCLCIRVGDVAPGPQTLTRLGVYFLFKSIV